MPQTAAEGEAALFARAQALLRELQGPGGAPPSTLWVPGRIEVVGKHTDYAEGKSLVCAIDRGLAFAYAYTDNGTVRIASESLADVVELPLCSDAPSVSAPSASSASSSGADWERYVAAVLSFCGASGRGAVVAVASNLPRSAGLSTSSALVCGLSTIVAARRLSPDDLGGIERLDVVGTKGGSQDHAAIMDGVPGALTLFDYARGTRMQRRVELDPSLCFVVAASGVRACKTDNALAAYNALAGAPPAEKQALARRETGHVLAACAALDAQDGGKLAAAVARSEAHSRSGLHTSVPETEFLVDEALALGALAASGFGAGFGGSVYAIARKDAAAALQAAWAERYRAAFPAAAERAAFFVTVPSRGCSERAPEPEAETEPADKTHSAKAETKVEIKSETKSETKSQTKSEAKTEVEVEAEANINVNVKATAKTTAKTTAKAKAKVKAKAQFRLGPQPDWAHTGAAPERDGAAFAAALLSEPAAASLRARGYAVVPLSAGARAQYDAFHAGFARFCARPLAERAVFAGLQFEPAKNSPNQYHGFSQVASLKTQFMMRLQGAGGALRYPRELLPAGPALFEALDAHCRALLAELAAESEARAKTEAEAEASRGALGWLVSWPVSWLAGWRRMRLDARVAGILDPLGPGGAGTQSECGDDAGAAVATSAYVPAGFVSSSIMDNFHYCGDAAGQAAGRAGSASPDNSDPEEKKEKEKEKIIEQEKEQEKEQEQQRFVNNHGAHTDSGLLTVVVTTDEPGLEVLDQRLGEWVAVEQHVHRLAAARGRSHRDFAVFMWGDSVAALEPEAPGAGGSRLQPCLHRVQRTDAERFSVVFKQRTSPLTTPPRYQEDYAIRDIQERALRHGGARHGAHFRMSMPMAASAAAVAAVAAVAVALIVTRK